MTTFTESSVGAMQGVDDMDIDLDFEMTGADAPLDDGFQLEVCRTIPNLT